MIVIFPLQAKDLEVFVIQPPKVMVDNVKTIALVGFRVLENNKLTWTSDYGAELSGYITSLLLKKQRGVVDHEKKLSFTGIGFKTVKGITFQDRIGCDIYTIVDRSTDAMVVEQQKSAAGFTDSVIVEMGKMFGAQALITGDISVTYSERKFTEKKKIDGKKVPVYCTELSVNTTVNIRLINTETAEIIASQTYPDPSEKKSKAFQCKRVLCNAEGDEPTLREIGGWLSGGWDCGDGLTDVQSIAKYHLRNIANQYAGYIAPTFALEKYNFKKPDFKGEMKKYKNNAKEAKEWAKKMKLHRAYAIYNGLLEKDEYNTALLYNVGVLEEVVGNYSAAEELFAEALDGKPNEKDFKKAVIRIEKHLHFEEMLKKIGIKITPFQWKEVDVDVEEKRVVLKERTDVFADPSENSKVVATPPKDRTFKVLSQEGEWFLLKLRGKKKGYINVRYVKIVE